MMLDAGFRSVWPIQPHLRFLISVSVGVCFVLSHSCSFETTSGHHSDVENIPEASVGKCLQLVYL